MIPPAAQLDLHTVSADGGACFCFLPRLADGAALSEGLATPVEGSIGKTEALSEGAPSAAAPAAVVALPGPVDQGPIGGDGGS